MTSKQIEALKYLIIKSKDAGGLKLTKQIFLLLIEKSKGLTKEVSITVSETEGLQGEEIDSASKHFMTSVHGTTHLHELMTLMGSELRFSLHYGHYNADGTFNNDGQFPDSRKEVGKPKMRYTFWLAKEFYGHGGMGEHIPFSLKEVQEVKLHSSLYNH